MADEVRTAGTAQGTEGRTAPTSEVLEGLNDLLKLDHDAVGAYEKAIEKLDNREHAEQIRGFKADHERHIREINDRIAELGGTPENEPHMTGPFKQALQSLGGLVGDKGVLMAWRTNELQVRTKYDSYASKAVFWPNPVKQTIDRNALDEERHYRWVVSTLESMGVDSGGEAGGGVGSAVRERAAELGDRAQELAGQAKERAGDLTTSARTHIADGLETTAHKLDDTAARQEPATGAKAKAGDLAHRVAGSMESAAESLRYGGGGGLTREDLEQRVREQPASTLLALFAAGFVVGRILR